MADINKYISDLSMEFSRLSVDVMNTVSNEQRLLYLYAYYHYFNADNSSIDDILSGDVHEWNSDDKIDGIYIDTEADDNDIDIVMVCYTDENEFDFPAVLKNYKDVEALLFSDIKSEPRKRITDVLKDTEFGITDERPVKIKIITNFSPKSAAKKKSILNALKTMKPISERVSYEISFGIDIEYEILEIENPKEYVDEASIVIDEPDNYITFGEEKSLIVNVSAKSLKSIYDLYGYRGLFSQNLRYYVKNAKVDDNVISSIQEHPDNFWYFNNGIILICDSYSTSGKMITLKKFSIINGGQTTKIIGETDFEKDFYIQCKVIKNKYIEEDDRLEFISNVAEASNTQKPIKDKDLIANRTEQRRLKKQLAASGVYCQIKRGEKVNKKLYPAAWQNTTNEELGQFILSFTYQRPGTARGSKASICENKERYTLLFGKTYNSQFLCDLLKIKAYYKLWTSHIKKTDDGADPYKVGLVNNGMFFMTSIIGVICKMYYHPEIIPAINDTIVSEQKMEILSQHDMTHGLFKEFDEPKKRFFELFEYCYSRFYGPGYEMMKQFKERTANNYSNFTKINNNYSTYIIKQIMFEFRNGIAQDSKKFLENYLYEASEGELSADRLLLDKYANVLSAEISEESNVPEKTVAAIKDALIDYRTKVCKKEKRKPFEVFRNVSCDRIARFAPISEEELKNLRCLDEIQLVNYGSQIISIIKEVTSEA